MIIGTGMIARAFKSLEKNPDILICAAGVSKSNEVNDDQFNKESELLKKAINLNKKIIYFSTFSINQPKENYSPYIIHKIKMEKLVSQSEKYIIYRVPQIVGYSNNSSLLLNYLNEKIKNGTYFTIWKNCFRSLIDVSDLVKIVNYSVNQPFCILNNKIHNIYNQNIISIEEIVKLFENLYKIKGNYSLVEKQEDILYSDKSGEDLVKNAGVEFDSAYNLKLIHKYYEKK